MLWRFADCELDVRSRELRRRSEVVPLTPKAFVLLELLLKRRPAAVSRQEIRDVLWPQTFVSESTLGTLIWEVRQAIGDRGRPGLIRTVRGFGYAFSADAASPAEPGPGSASPPCRLVWGDRAFPLAAGENLLGRDEGARLCLDAPSVSRRHARIVVEDSGATLEDLGSKNRTRLNGEPIQGAVPLVDGDRIRLGEVLLLFRCRPSDAPTATRDE